MQREGESWWLQVYDPHPNASSKAYIIFYILLIYFWLFFLSFFFFPFLFSSSLFFLFLIDGVDYLEEELAVDATVHFPTAEEQAQLIKEVLRFYDTSAYLDLGKY